MSRSRSQFRLFELVMSVILCALILAFARELSQVPQRKDSLHGSVILIGIAFGIWFAVWKAVRARRAGLVCPECGRRYSPHGQLADSNVCARCRAGSLPRVQARREQRIATLAFFLGTAIVMGLFGLPYWNSFNARFGQFSWILFPLLAVGAALGLFAAVFAVAIVIFLFRNWRLRFERPTLALARKSARGEGTIARTGPLTIWWSGPTDPVPMLTEQLGIARQRFEHLIDEPVDTPPLRVLVFDKRRAFVAYHRNVVSDKGIFDCLYSGRPARAITISTDVPRVRLVDEARSMRAGLVLYFLETYKGFFPSNWLQLGISGALSSGPGGDVRVLLNRRMKVALANGTDLKTLEFVSRLPGRQVREHVGPLVDHAPFARLTQFRGQSCSVFEYLAGSEAPADRLGRFRSFLSDVKSTGSDEEVFARHFGHGFDALLEQWREWVGQQSLGSDPAPPPEVRAAIIDRLIPAIVDQSKQAQDRIQAMRSLGSAGYVLGAGTLINVLREADPRFTQTATWALESISGLASGSDADQWSEWWAGRDPDAVGALEFVERS